MAIFNEILVGRFNRALQKVTGIKGGPSVPQLAGEIYPVLPIFSGVDSRALESWALFAAAVQVTGAVGATAAVRFRIPNTSNVLAVIQQVIITFDALDLINVRVEAAAGSNDLVGIEAGKTNFDVRAGGPAAIISSTTNIGVIIGANVAQIRGNAFSDYLIRTPNQEIPLVGTGGIAGATISFSSNTNAATMRISIFWRERLLEESERA